MRILAAAAPDSSGVYRVRLPFEHIDGKDGVKAEILDQGLPLRLDAENRRFLGVDIDCDVVVLQRPMQSFMPALIQHLQDDRGIKVVVELDDDFHTAHPQNTAFRLNHPKTNPHANWHHLGECVRRADLVTVSTPALAKRYGSHGRVIVLRNCVDDRWMDIPASTAERTLGWAGSLVNHPVDLQAARGAAGEALEAHPGWRFLNVGGEKYRDQIAANLHIRDLARFDATPWRSLDLHPYLVRHLTVGIVPLHDSAFNAAKSCLKGLEYAALGIPFVASGLPEYERLARVDGLGVAVAPKTKLWRRELDVLMSMESEALRCLGGVYRDKVRRDHLYSGNAWRWVEAYASVLDRAAV